jgi:FlhB-like protein
MSSEDQGRYPGRKAVALRYDVQKDSAPRVVAKGQRLVADKIIEIAKEHGITLYEDPDLVAMLAQLEVDAQIPEDLYRAVAEVLAFVYRINDRMLPPGE